ncbi:MAG: DNA repair photolyase, partial [Erythrobacteraceae bacterium]|nr:DNA repair photolyase [Erythrobacteraceae bacterium]
MIVSASYKTDIPAFYGDWLLKRLSEGSCRVRNA